jgi:hypothetical protein
MSQTKRQAPPSAAKPPAKDPSAARRTVERVQTGVRIEKRILQVLKALGEVHGLSLGDLLEGIVLHAFEGKAPFGAASLERIAALRKVYGLDLTAADSHLLVEAAPAPRRRKTVRP